MAKGSSERAATGNASIWNRVMPQVRFSIGESFLARSGEAVERFGYDVYGPEVGIVYPRDKPLALFAALGGEFSHSDETSLGSGRYLVNGEIGGRGFIPWPFLRRFVAEAGAKVGAGYSRLNFGGGDNPEGGVDADVGLLGRLLFDFGGFALGAGASYAFSPLRGYTEFGFNVVATVPLHAKFAIGSDDRCQGLPELEEEADKNYARAMGAYSELQGWRHRLELKAQSADLQFRAYEEFAGRMKEAGFSCPRAAAPGDIEKIRLPVPPRRPVRGTCEELIDRMKSYAGDLDAYYTNLTRDGGVRARLKKALQSADADAARFAGAKTGLCETPSYTVMMGNKAYRLMPEMLFANDNPDISLSEQKDDGNKAGFTEPNLDEWIRFLLENPEYKIRIDGYASDNYDAGNYPEEKMVALARARAENVSWYFVNKGKDRARYKGRVEIGNEFVPYTAIGSLAESRIDKVTGHGFAGLKALAKSYFGKGNDGDAESLLSDPTFRVVRITLMQEGADGNWHPVPLEKIGARR